MNLYPRNRIEKLANADGRGCAVMMTKWIALFWLVTTGIQVNCSVCFARQAPPANIMSVVPGFNGTYKAGYWTSVKVALRGNWAVAKGILNLKTHDANGVLFTVSEPFEINTDEEKAIRILTKPGLMTTRMTVTLTNSSSQNHDSEQVYDQRTVDSKSAIASEKISAPKSPQTELILRIGPSMGEQQVIKRTNTNSHLATILRVEDLPTAWLAYEGVNTILLSLSDEKFNEKLLANKEALAAINRWVEMGGQLIVSVGKQAKQVFQADTALLKMMPGTFDQLMQLPDSSPIETYVSSRIRLSEHGRTEQIQVARLKEVRGVVEAYYGETPLQLPLIIRSAHQFGQVLFVGFDLNSETLRQWGKAANQSKTGSFNSTGDLQGRDKLLAKLLGRNLTATENSPTLSLESELRSVLDHFETSKIFPFWLIAVLIISYLAVIGPFDYFLVKMVFRKTLATWVTFPLAVLLTAVLAYVIAWQLKGEQAQVNLIDVVDIDISDGENPTAHIRGTSLCNLFSADMQTYDFALEAKPGLLTIAKENRATTSESWLSVFGVPNKRSKEDTILSRNHYMLSQSLSEVQRAAIPQWSSKMLLARWKNEVSLSSTPQLTTGTGQRLRGTIKNMFGCDLTDCVLVEGNNAYKIGNLKVDQEIRVEDLTVFRIERFLTTEWGIEKDLPIAKQTESTAAQQESIKSLLKRMMFGVTLRSKQTLFVEPNYLSHLDMTEMLKVNKAILVGFSKKPATRLIVHQSRENQPLSPHQSVSLSVLRVIIPIKKP